MLQRIREILRRDLIRSYLSNMSWMVGEKFIAFPILFLINTVMVPRALGPENFGLLSYSQSMVMLLSVFTSLGLDTIAVRELVRAKTNEQRYEILGSSWFVKFAGTLFFLILLVVVTGLLQESFYIKQIIMIIGAGYLFFSFNVIEFYYQAIVQAKYAVWARLLMIFMVAGWRLVLIFSEAELIYYAVALMAEQVIFGILLIAFYHKQGHSIWRWSVSKQVVGNLLKDAWPMFLSGLFITLYMRIDQVMLKNMIGEAENGIYAVAVRISELWYFIPVAFTASVFPAIVKSKEQSERLYRQRVQWMFDAMFLLSLTVALFFSLFADWLMTLLYDNRFPNAADILKVHAWSGIFVAVGVARGKWIITENLQRYTMLYLMTGAVLNVLLNLLFIPAYQGLGSAWATLIAYAVANLIVPGLFKDTRLAFFMFLKSIFGVTIIRFIINYFRQKQTNF